MNRIAVGQPLSTQLEDLAETVEVVDEKGRPLGHFVRALGDDHFAGLSVRS